MSYRLISGPVKSGKTTDLCTLARAAAVNQQKVVIIMHNDHDATYYAGKMYGPSPCILVEQDDHGDLKLHVAALIETHKPEVLCIDGLPVELDPHQLLDDLASAYRNTFFIATVQLQRKPQ